MDKLTGSLLQNTKTFANNSGLVQHRESVRETLPGIAKTATNVATSNIVKNASSVSGRMSQFKGLTQSVLPEGKIINYIVY